MTSHEYRTTRGLSMTEGYVIHGPDDGEPCGWSLSLTDPSEHRPGCVAVDCQGNRWFAQGGDDAHGAAEWVPESTIVLPFPMA